MAPRYVFNNCVFKGTFNISKQNVGFASPRVSDINRQPATDERQNSVPVAHDHPRRSIDDSAIPILARESESNHSDTIASTGVESVKQSQTMDIAIVEDDFVDDDGKPLDLHNIELGVSDDGLKTCLDCHLCDERFYEYVGLLDLLGIKKTAIEHMKKESHRQAYRRKGVDVPSSDEANNESEPKKNVTIAGANKNSEDDPQHFMQKLFSN